ncbi:MAG: hypothetical protein ABIV92_05200 [Thermoflexales bacterium]
MSTNGTLEKLSRINLTKFIEILHPGRTQRVAFIIVGSFSFSIAFGGLCLVASSGWPIDDALITYKYAENLAYGYGFVYNLGERIQGTSTPLFTGLMTIVTMLFGSRTVEVGSLIGVLAAITCVLSVFGMVAKGSSRGAAILAALALGLDAYFLFYASSGMESHLFAALVIVALWSCISGKYTTAAIISAICMLMRLDGATVALAVLAAQALKQRRLPLREMAVITVIVLPWFVFAQLYFGTVFPASMLAKQSHAFEVDRLWMIRAFLSRPYALFMPFFIVAVALVLLSRDFRERTLPLVVWWFAYVGAYAAFGIPGYGWYRIPAVTVFFAIVGFGCGEMARIAASIYARKEVHVGLLRPGTPGLIALLLFSSVPLAYEIRYSMALAPQARISAEALDGQRHDVAIWLEENTPGSSVIASDGIGYLGYFTHRYIVDLAGLVTPSAVGKDREAQIAVFRPDYVVVVAKEADWGGHEFSNDYELVRRWPQIQDGLSHFVWRRIQQ